MSPTPDGAALRTARRTRGWSLTDTANRLVALGAERGVPVATVRSLRSQLSRWENGHALPEPGYRSLLAELLGESTATLGIEPSTSGPVASAADRLRAALAEGTAVDERGIGLWRQQLSAARWLDDASGGAAAAGIVLALVDRLEHLLTHTAERRARVALAEILSDAAALAGAQALDRRAYDEAWRHHVHARRAAQTAANPLQHAAATAGLVDVLVDIDEPGVALALLAEARAEIGSEPDSALSQATSAADGGVGARLAAATAVAQAAAGRSGEALASLVDAAPPVVVDRVYPAWLAVEIADLHRWRGRALVLLGADAAPDELRRAMLAGPRSVRHRAEVLADLATALTGVDPAEAAEHAREARSLALRIGSTRIVARLTPA